MKQNVNDVSAAAPSLLQLTALDSGTRPRQAEAEVRAWCREAVARLEQEAAEAEAAVAAAEERPGNYLLCVF